MLPSWVVQICPSLALAKAHTNIPIVVNVMCGTCNEPLQKLFRLADISFSTSMWEVKDHSVEDSWPNFPVIFVASTSCKISTFLKADNLSMFSTAKSLFAKTARESKDIATILTDFSDNADAKQTVNEKLPSLPIKTLFK